MESWFLSDLRRRKCYRICLHPIVGWGEMLISTIVELKEALCLQDGAQKECFSWSFSDGLRLASFVFRGGWRSLTENQCLFPEMARSQQATLHSEYKHLQILRPHHTLTIFTLQISHQTVKIPFNYNIDQYWYHL